MHAATLMPRAAQQQAEEARQQQAAQQQVERAGEQQLLNSGRNSNRRLALAPAASQKPQSVKVRTVWKTT